MSPSGDGVKALVKITHPERHRDHFRALIAYFNRQHGLEVDESGINESRACFESYDPDLIVKDDYVKFGAFTSEHAEAQVPSNEAYSYTDYMKLNLAARMIRNAKDGEKWVTLNRAAILCGGYISAGRMEEDEVLRILFREIEKRDIDSDDHAKQTIIAGVEKGKALPIKEIIEDEKTAQREMLINDGDMSFISSDDEDFRWIDDYSQGKVAIGLDTGDAVLDKYFRYKKENRTASVKMHLMQFASDRKVQDMNYAQRKAAYKWVQEHFTIINNNQVYSYSDIILFMEKVMRQQHVDAIFIDPYVAVWLNMHAFTEAQRRKGPDGLPVAPYAEDTEGGGKFVNRCDCFLTIHRKVQSPDHNIRKMSELHVRKVREVETGGQPTSVDDPYQILMNLSHTGFISWLEKKPLFLPIDFQQDKQKALPFVDFLAK